MRKIFLLGAMVLLTGCSVCTSPDCDKSLSAKQPEPEVQAQPATVTMPCMTGCAQSGCVGRTEPVVLKPRVLEKVQPKHKRPCCDDGVDLLAGEDEYYVPDAPEIYVISANRTVNSMQTEAAAFFKQVGNIKVYIDKAEAKADDLPGGIEKGTKTLQNRFEQMENVKVIKLKRFADYVVSSRADWFDTATKTVPAIKYDLFLKAPDGQVVGEWSEIIHQAEGDRSWW